MDLPDYHAFHATRADLLRRLGHTEQAVTAYDTAAALAPVQPNETTSPHMRLRSDGDHIIIPMPANSATTAPNPTGGGILTER